MTHVTCRLTAKNRDQPRNPTLGNRVRATFTFFTESKVQQKLYSHFDLKIDKKTEQERTTDIDKYQLSLTNPRDRSVL